MRAIQVVAAGAFTALSGMAHTQHAPIPTPSCVNQFPYGPEQFLEKFLPVAGEADPNAVLAKFQQSFGVKFPSETLMDSQIHTYNLTKCEWYTRVLIQSFTDSKVSQGTRVFLILGDLPHPLTFGSGRDECLSSDLAERSLTSSGWKGGVRGEAAIWIYWKGRTSLDFHANGKSKPGDASCVTEVNIRYQ